MADMTYIKLYRKVADNELFLELPYDRWHAFEYLLLRAHRFPVVKVLKGQKVYLETGQLIEGVDSLAEKWGWSRGKVIRFLSLLEELEMIKKNGTPCGTVITIENYAKYQGCPTSNGTSDSTPDGTSDSTPDGTSDGTHIKKDKKDKKVKKDKNIYSAVPAELESAFSDYAAMREKKKKPITTENTVTRILNKLNQMADTTEGKIAILNQSTDRCWIDVYELKEDEPKKPATPEKKQTWADVLGVKKND